MRYERAIRQTFRVTSVSGQEFLCMCPFHDDTSHGHLYVNGMKGLYFCQSCGAKGSMDRLGVEAPLLRTDDIRERLAAMRKPPAKQRYYPERWLDQFDVVPHPYWTEVRGLPKDVVDKFRLGYDPMVPITDKDGNVVRYAERLTLPLRDYKGRILGVTHRRLDDGKPKYQHPKGFPIGRHLYGSWLLTDQQKVALVEGQVDAVRCWSARVPALSLMGNRITPDQIKVLQRLGIRHVVLMLDNDLAGIRGTVSIHEALHDSGIRVSAGWYRPYWFGVKDPDGLTDHRIRKMFHSSLPITEWAAKVLPS